MSCSRHAPLCFFSTYHMNANTFSLIHWVEFGMVHDSAGRWISRFIQPKRFQRPCTRSGRPWHWPSSRSKRWREWRDPPLWRAGGMPGSTRWRQSFHLNKCNPCCPPPSIIIIITLHKIDGPHITMKYNFPFDPIINPVPQLDRSRSGRGLNKGGGWVEGIKTVCRHGGASARSLWCLRLHSKERYFG